MSYKKQSIPKTLKNKVWDTYIGRSYGIGKCYCCRKDIDSKNFECGHVKAESKGGKLCLSNLRPICGPCNRSMGNEHMHKFMRRCGFININLFWKLIYQIWYSIVIIISIILVIPIIDNKYFDGKYIQPYVPMILGEINKYYNIYYNKLFYYNTGWFDYLWNLF